MATSKSRVSSGPQPDAAAFLLKMAHLTFDLHSYSSQRSPAVPLPSLDPSITSCPVGPGPSAPGPPSPEHSVHQVTTSRCCLLMPPRPELCSLPRFQSLLM